jgi:hypothetical protein
LAEQAGEDDATLNLAPSPSAPESLGVDRYEDAPGAFDLAAAERSGALAMLTDPMADDVEVLGQPMLGLRCRSDRDSGLIVARLLDIDPSGAAVRMTSGALNLLFRGDPAEPAPTVASEWMDVAALFQATAWRLKAGHRLGLLLGADGWPTLWPDRSGARIDVSGRSLELRLPLAAGCADAVLDAPRHVARAEVGEAKWIDPDQERPLPTGLSGAAFETRGAHHLPATGTDYLSASRFEVALDADGRQATAVKVSRSAFERPGWSIRVDTRLSVASTPDAFQINWSIRAEHDGAVVHDHTESSTVPAESSAT